TQRHRFHHSAVEQDVRGTGKSAAAAADARCLGTVANLFREKTREMLGDGGVGRVRQAQLLKANTALAGRQLVACNPWKKSLYQDLIEVFARQFRLNRATDEFRPLAQQCDWTSLRLGRFEQLFLGHSTLMPQDLQLPDIDAIACGFRGAPP